MITNYDSSGWVTDLVDAMPRQPGEDEARKVERIGKHIGVRGRTIYRWMNPHDERQVPITKLSELIEMVLKYGRAEMARKLCHEVIVTCQAMAKKAEGSGR